MLKIHDNIPHIKGVTAIRVKHKFTGNSEVFIMAGRGRWRCSRLSPICPRAPIMGGHLLCGPYWGCAAPNGHFLSPDSLAKGVFLAKIP